MMIGSDLNCISLGLEFFQFYKSTLKNHYMDRSLRLWNQALAVLKVKNLNLWLYSSQGSTRLLQLKAKDTIQISFIFGIVFSWMLLLQYKGATLSNWRIGNHVQIQKDINFLQKLYIYINNAYLDFSSIYPMQPISDNGMLEVQLNEGNKWIRGPT